MSWLAIQRTHPSAPMQGRNGLRKWGKDFLDQAQRSWAVIRGTARWGRWKSARYLEELKVKHEDKKKNGVKQATLLGSALLLSVSCGLLTERQDKEGELPSLAPGTPELSKARSTAKRPSLETPWQYVLPIDHGVRADSSGKGHFRASRFHGEHNGLDLLAPIGTPTFAACDGQARSGASSSFGRWVHVICPVPSGLVKDGGPTPWASFFYAHLDRADVPFNQWTDVKRGQIVGQVGKTGNSRGPNIQPHLHLEFIVQKNRRSAMDERHLGSDQSQVGAADYFVSALDDQCLSPLGLQPKSKKLQRARRIDPFLALVCLSKEKPSYAKAPEPLQFASAAWSDFYIAKDFNINRDLRDLRN